MSANMITSVNLSFIGISRIQYFELIINNGNLYRLIDKIEVKLDKLNQFLTNNVEYYII